MIDQFIYADRAPTCGLAGKKKVSKPQFL